MRYEKSIIPLNYLYNTPLSLFKLFALLYINSYMFSKNMNLRWSYVGKTHA